MTAELELLRRRYVRKLDDLYGGEMEHLNVLPEMAGVAQSSALKRAIQYHFEKTKVHIERLDQIFARLGIRPINLERREAEALAQEAQPFLATQDEWAGCDAVLISATCTMEHHEISGYLLALRYAQILRDHAAADLLEQTLKEEYEADQVLAELARATKSVESGANRITDGSECADALGLALAGYGETAGDTVE